MFEIIKPATGEAPSLVPEKLCKILKPVPFVLRANAVPLPRLPALSAVPYRVSPDKIKVFGPAPSLLVRMPKGLVVLLAKLCRVVNPVPSVLMEKMVPLPKVPPREVAPYRVFPDKINPPVGYVPSLLVA